MAAIKIFKRFRELLDVNWAAISDGQLLKRSGMSVIGSDAGGMLAPVVVATTGNIDLTTGGIPDPSLTDQVTVAVGQRVLVWEQIEPLEIGVYIVQTGSWTRAPDMPVMTFDYPDNPPGAPPSPVDGLMISTGSNGSAFSGAVFQFLSELQAFQPCAGGAVQTPFNFDPVTGPETMSLNGISATTITANNILPGGQGPIIATANFVANGSTVDQLRDSLIAAGIMKAS